MKLRLRGNSIRLRLLRGEVRQLGLTGNVTETTRFGLSDNENLTFTLAASTATESIAARFAGNQITVLLPETTAREWVESDEISLNGEQVLNERETLKILIEKDFVCLDRVDDADNVDAYPHPKPDKKRC